MKTSPAFFVLIITAGADYYHGIISPQSAQDIVPDFSADEWFWHRAGEDVAPQYAALFDQIEQQKAERAAIAEVKRPKRRSGRGPSAKRIAEEGDRAGGVDLSSPDLTEPRADGKGSDYD